MTATTAGSKREPIKAGHQWAAACLGGSAMILGLSGCGASSHEDQAWETTWQSQSVTTIQRQGDCIDYSSWGNCVAHEAVAPLQISGGTVSHHGHVCAQSEGAARKIAPAGQTVTGRKVDGISCAEEATEAAAASRSAETQASADAKEAEEQAASQELIAQAQASSAAAEASAAATAERAKKAAYAASARSIVDRLNDVTEECRSTGIGNAGGFVANLNQVNQCIAEMFAADDPIAVPQGVRIVCWDATNDDLTVVAADATSVVRYDYLDAQNGRPIRAQPAGTTPLLSCDPS